MTNKILENYKKTEFKTLINKSFRSIEDDKIYIVTSVAQDAISQKSMVVYRNTFSSELYTLDLENFLLKFSYI